MKFEIVQLNDYCGPKASVYSVYLNNEPQTLFEQFLEEYADIYPDEINNLLTRLDEMVNKYGMIPRFFKTAEGTKGSDNLVALFDEEKQLRVYAIWYNQSLIIIGGGGPKPPGKVVKWQDDKVLKKAAETMIKIDRSIREQIDNGNMEIEGDSIYLNEDID